MSLIELIPVDKGNRFTLDNTVVTTIGRTQNIGCVDKKISRNHAELFVKSDGTLWIKPIHHNPTFYRTKPTQLITLIKDQEFQLNDNDEIGLLPNEYFYRISIKSNDKTKDQPEPSTVPKSPIQEQKFSPIQEQESSPIEEKQSSPIKNSDDDQESSNKDPNFQPEGGIILHTTRALPSWMTDSSSSPAKNAKGLDKGKKTVTPTKVTPSPSKYRTYIGRKKAEGVVYEDDDSNEAPATSTEVKSQTSTIVIDPSKRKRCPYGKFCYRKNPIHRQENIHPGDPDWNNKENDNDKNNTNKPECPYGSDCYRKNPDHFNEYNHSEKRSSTNKTKRHGSKRKGISDDDEDDDDGLPNEYDYNDSFIDDEELDDSVRVDREENSQGAPDKDWKPHKKARNSEDFDNENDSTDDSEIDLLKEEAKEFVQGSSVNKKRPAKMKADVHIPDDDD